MGHTLFCTGEFVEANAHFDKGLALYNAAEHRPLATRFWVDSRIVIKDWIDHRDSIARLFADAREKCKVARVKFKEFRERHAPGFGRTQLYELLRVGRGVLSIEDQRERERVKKQAQRAPKKAAEPSGTRDVPDTQARRITGSNVMSDEEAKARMAALDREEPPAKVEEPVAGEAASPVLRAELEPEQQPAPPLT